MISRGKILIYSNCQGIDLLRLMRTSSLVSSLYDTKLIQFHLVAETEEALSPVDFEGVTTVWEQLGSDYPDLRSQMHALKPINATTITFPSLNMLALWPFTGIDSRLIKDGLYPAGRYPWTDFVAAGLAETARAQPFTDRDLLDCYLQLSARQMPDLDRRLAMDVTRWQEKDATCDIKVADYLLETFRSKQLFYSFARPTPVAIRRILCELLALTMGNNSPLMAVQLEIEQLLQYYMGYDMEEFPINPFVADHFKLDWYSKSTLYRHHSNAFTYDEFMVRYIRYDPYLRGF